MWTTESRALVGDFGAGQALSDEQYALLAPLIPPAKPGGRPRTTERLRPARGPAGLLPARADPGHRAPARGQHRLRPPPPALGGGEDARLARQVAPPRQGVRGAARGLRDHGQAGRDPPHAAPPRPPEPQAATRSLTSQTASELDFGHLQKKTVAKQGLDASSPLPLNH